MKHATLPKRKFKNHRKEIYEMCVIYHTKHNCTLQALDNK